MKDLKTVEMLELPSCDFCRDIAAYDGKTSRGPWAYMCEKCFKIHGTGLGTGKGQKLALKA